MKLDKRCEWDNSLLDFQDGSVQVAVLRKVRTEELQCGHLIYLNLAAIKVGFLAIFPPWEGRRSSWTENRKELVQKQNCSSCGTPTKDTVRRHIYPSSLNHRTVKWHVQGAQPGCKDHKQGTFMITVLTNLGLVGAS